ncbi:MAG: succinyldiaminopimelate transaminase [Burkholderiales bacterium]|nr:succinyldiaminopimelate transaminase [Burkholderiales bacterium]
MNADLAKLQPYPFERLRALFAGATPPAALPHINLSIGEPKHATPPLIKEALVAHLGGLSNYPVTAGTDALRQAVAAWLQRRYQLASLDAATQVLPVNGSREALFSFAQAVIDRSREAIVVSPNPFYQIYEGAALLAGARPLFLPTTPANGFRMDFASVPPGEWAKAQLVYVCTPGNPTGRVMTLDEWRELFALSDKHGFVIASDECYSEIYFEEGKAPLGGLQAAGQLGRDRFERLVVFGSLSKRSNAPGLRSGFVAGDATILRQFLLYRTYHGNAMSPPVQAASIAAWNDEAHVAENRRKYASKFDGATPVIGKVLATQRPDAAFYLWARTPIDDERFAQRLYAEQHVTVLPGSYLSRTVNGHNPGAGFVRVALVAEVPEVLQAAERIAAFGATL